MYIVVIVFICIAFYILYSYSYKDIDKPKETVPPTVRRTEPVPDSQEEYVRLSQLENPSINNLYDDPYPRRYLSLKEYVPRSTLKETEENTRNFGAWLKREGQPGYRDHDSYPIPEYHLVGREANRSEDRFRPFYYNYKTSLATYDDPWYSRSPPNRRLSYGDNTFWNNNSLYWVSSVNQHIPLRPVDTKWEKVGILSTTSETDDTILNLYRRPIAPMQNLFEWSVQNVDGMVVQISLNDPEDGDIIPSVPGMESKGSWKLSLYSKNAYVLV